MIFLNISFRFTTKLRMYRDCSFPQTTQSPTLSTPLLDGTFFNKDEPTLTHHNHPWSTVCITVCSWCCTFCKLRQMYNDMYPSL